MIAHPFRTISSSSCSSALNKCALSAPSEERLWQAIRSQQLGVSFRRPVVIGRYIVDFCALSLKLIVEVDGSVHTLKRASDQRRTEKLERGGYRVLRLDARIVMRDLPRAVALIRAVVAERASTG